MGDTFHVEKVESAEIEIVIQKSFRQVTNFPDEYPNNLPCQILDNTARFFLREVGSALNFVKQRPAMHLLKHEVEP